MRFPAAREQAFLLLLAASFPMILTSCTNTNNTPVYFSASQSAPPSQQARPLGPTSDVSEVLLGSSLAPYKGHHSIVFVPWTEMRCRSASQCQDAIVENKIKYKLSGRGNSTVAKGQLISTSGSSATIETYNPGIHSTYKKYLVPGTPLLRPRSKYVDFTIDFAHDTATLDGLYGSVIKVKLQKGHVSVGSSGNEIVSN